MGGRKPLASNAKDANLLEDKTCAEYVRFRRCSAMLCHITIHECCECSTSGYREAQRRNA